MVMYSDRFRKRGVVLVIVLCTLLVVIGLATVVLSFILTHARLSYHNTSRIQAYYASMSGINYALEQLRTGEWTYSPINSCPDGEEDDNIACTLEDTDGFQTDFPTSIKGKTVYIVFCPAGQTCFGTRSIYAVCNPPAGLSFCINATTTYTYSP